MMTRWRRNDNLFGGATLALSVALTGCAVGPQSAPPLVSVQGAALHGTVYGGLQPVGRSSIQLFTPGTSGYGSAATPLLRTPVTADASGNFSITGDYTCPYAAAEVYMVVAGGNPGLADGTSNSALVLMSLLGPCGSLGPSTFLSVNELSTVAAVYALQPFMLDQTHVGAPTSNQSGINSAFLSAASLVSLPGHTPGNAPALAVIPVKELNTLGDALSSCVNSDGNLSLTTPCGRLFQAVTPTGSAAPTDTVGATLDLARNPGHNASSIFNLVTPNGPYQPTLASAPLDWTIGINYVAPAFRTPADLAIDSQGVVWVLGAPGTQNAGSTTVSAFTVNGLVGSYPQSTANYGNMAIDPTDNIWLTDTNRSDIVKLTNAGTRANFSPFTGGGMQGPGPIAFDPAGNAWVVNNSATVSAFSASGTPLSSSAYQTGGANGPVAIAIDAQGQVWTADSAGNTVTKLANAGASINGSPFTGNSLNGPSAIAFDSFGNAHVVNRASSSVTTFSATGTPPSSSSAVGAGLNAPVSLMLDGGNAVWAANGNSNSVSVLRNDGSAQSGGAGYGSAFLSNPYKLAIDGSGSVWVASLGTSVAGSGVITQLVGAAAPVITPLALAVQRNAIATRP